MIFSVQWFVRTIVEVAMVSLTLQAARATGEQTSAEAFEPLAMSAQSVTGVTVRPVRTYVRWKDHEYAVEAGVAVLMNVVRDLEESAHQRELALAQLAMLMGQLQGHPCLDELGRIYDSAGELEKQLILTCFKGSRDPRGIPVFIRTLNKEQSMQLRLSAAASLAQWNIRRGVAELVDLLDSKEILPQPARMPYVRDNALDLFRTKNRLKGWGFPDDKESAEWPPDVIPPPDVAARLKPPPTVEEIRKWFAENEHRFPDWKLGDALPEVPAPDKDKPNEE